MVSPELTVYVFEYRKPAWFAYGNGYSIRTSTVVTVSDEYESISGSTAGQFEKEEPKLYAWIVTTNGDNVRLYVTLAAFISHNPDAVAPGEVMRSNRETAKEVDEAV